MGTQPPLFNVTLNHEETQMIIHINCESDGRQDKWMVDKEESSKRAKTLWLVKLGCMAKIHLGFDSIFNDPWANRIADFPENYKLFAVKRKAGAASSSREDHYLCGGSKRYRSPQEFYPHMHWLLNNTRGECICKHCDHTRSQKEIDKIFHLPPHKESPKGPIGPKKHKRTKKPKAPRGVTSQREMVINRNSITTGTVSTLQHDRQEQRIIGFRRSHPFKL